MTTPAVNSRSGSRLARFLTGALFVVAGIAHFRAPHFYQKIMPPFLPVPKQIILVSGLFEVLGGLGLWIPRFSRSAALGLAVLLVAVYPANIYHTLIRKRFPGFLGSARYHIIRLPLQGLLIWWVWRFRRDREV